MTNDLKELSYLGESKDLGELVDFDSLRDNIVSYKSGYFADGFAGMEYWNKSELVDYAMMEKSDFKTIERYGKSKGKNNLTVYFINQNNPYIYVECYFANVDRYSRFILSKEVFYKYNLADKAISLNVKGDSIRSVPYVNVDGNMKAIHKLFGIKGEVDHKTLSYNLITEDNFRLASHLLNEKNYLQLDIIMRLCTGGFKIFIEEDRMMFSEDDLVELEKMGFEIKPNKKLKITKVVGTKADALRAIKEYEDRFYGEFAYSPINDLRGRFDLKFQQLILGTMTEDDVIKTVLNEYAHDAYSVHRYNLIPLCEKYGIPYNEGITLPNGDLVNE